MLKAPSPPSGRQRNEPALLYMERCRRARPAPPTQQPTELSQGVLSTPGVPPPTPDRPPRWEPSLKTFPASGEPWQPGQCLGVPCRGAPHMASFSALCLQSLQPGHRAPMSGGHGRCGLPCTWRELFTVAPYPRPRFRPSYVPGSEPPKKPAVGGCRSAACPWPGRDGCLPSAARHSGVQARALGDTQLGHLLGAGGVDAHRPHHLRVGGPTPAHRGGGGGFRR